MSWLKLLRHDLACGLGRWRYLLAAASVILGSFSLWAALEFYGTIGTGMDYMLQAFLGREPVVIMDTSDRIELPLFWMLLMGGCLFCNLDYLLTDLTIAGQQIILRSGTRRGWFLSKCVWNLCATALYVAIAFVTSQLFAWLTGGEISLLVSEEGAMILEASADAVTAWASAVAGIFLPLLTLCALSMLEMTLCLVVKPVVSFLICMAVLVLAVYWNSPFALGNGAMTARSGIGFPDRIDPGTAALTAAAVIVLCVIVGTLRFRRTDILGLEE